MTDPTSPASVVSRRTLIGGAALAAASLLTFAIGTALATAPKDRLKFRIID